MLRILIVDDEPIITNGLHELLSPKYAEQAEVLRTYSAVDALRLLDEARIDIIISDIEMPKMDGITLMQEVRSRWPYCRIIFLTGHDKFRYAYSAISGGVSAFILKTETDDKIIAAVDRCINEIVKENDNEEFLRRLQSELDESRILMQRETIWRYLKGKANASSTIHRLQMYGIPLLPDARSVLICGRIDKPANIDMPAEKQARIKTLFYQYTRSIGNSFLLFEDNDRYFHSILQPHTKRSGITFILCEALERMQEACSTAGLEISFLVDDREDTFENLPARFSELSQFLHYWLSEDQGQQLLQADYFTKSVEAGELAHLQQRPARAEILNRFRSTVENADRCGYFETLSQIKKILISSGDESLLRMEVIATVVSILTACINKRRLAKLIPSAAYLTLLTLSSKKPDEIYDCLAAFGEQLFNAIERAQRSKDEAFVEDIHEYIKQNISQNITLLQIAQHLHFNPAYLARLYKQITGVSLSNVIIELKMNRARELILQKPHLKIYEVAAMVGYDYPAYFTRVFKKHFGNSPLEYKEKMI